ncbi:unnamed protein product [Alopecurus aequalis]
MESPSSERWPDVLLGKWRDNLRDRNFWLNGYHRAVHNVNVVLPSRRNSGISWIVGVGPMASFTRAISGAAFERINELDKYEHVIKVYLQPAATVEEAQGSCMMSIKYQVTLAAAKELGLLDETYNMLKEEHDQLQYHTYGYNDAAAALSDHLSYHLSPLVGKKLSAKKYLLVVDNLSWPIETGSLTRDCGLPPPMWSRSRWLISPSSQDAYNDSKSQDDEIFSIGKEEHVIFFTMFALHQSAEHIFSTIRQESLEYWHAIALDCFHYTMVIVTNHLAVSSDELIHQWATVLPRMTGTISSGSKCSYMYLLGRVILEAFQKYSLLQLSSSPANKAHEATNTGAQFVAYHGLIAEGIPIDEISDNKKKWISLIGYQGCHVSPDWLSHEETSGTMALILRGACSEQWPIFSKLDHFLPKLCFLRVLDLSYTRLTILPYSIGCLYNLRLLSLRGCDDLKTLFTSVTNSTKNTSSYSPLSSLYHLEILDMKGVPFSHLAQDMANQKSNLIYLDMSSSEIITFPPNFFRDMSNLEELILVNCSNLVELPPSMAALSSLTTLEITGTQIKYFPQKIFEEMQKLQSLKLINNNNLISLCSPISTVHEIKLEGHPNLKSFLLIGAPRIQRLSLHGCRKLESVVLKYLGDLEELDLCGTAIKELPADIPNGTQLRRLLLSGVPCLRRFPWHMLERLPEVFYLDQCIEGNANHTGKVSQLYVSDPRFFHSFRKSCVDSVRAGRYFQSFYARVAPCSTNTMRLQHEEGMLDNKLLELVQKQSTYMDVHGSCSAEEFTTVSPFAVPFHGTERHIEITRMQQLSDGLYNFLNVTKSITVTYDTSISLLSKCSSFQDLEECELRWCHKMEEVFSFGPGLRKLKNLQACNLKSLVRFCSSNHSFAFSSLEHLHLQYCPRLEAMMVDEVTLPCLKTLDILFCYNLRKIFHRWGARAGHQLLPNLQRVRLQELPLLQQFNENDAIITAPMWKELHVRGCWSLGRIPRLHDQSKKVKVNGERSWWSNLQWGSPLHRDSYEPKLPPKFASFNERAVVTSYLR